MKMLNIGFYNYVPKDKITAIVKYDTAPIKRLVGEAKDRGIAINACNGKPTCSVIFTTSDYIVLSSMERKTLVRRVENDE